MNVVYAVNTNPTNAALVEDLVTLGYLQQNWYTLDPTYGKGNWWKNWEPDNLQHSDLAQDGTDFTNLPWPDNTFQAVVFDPPYVAVANGKRKEGEFDLHDRYGLHQIPTRPLELQALINQGMVETARVLKPKGYLLVKTMDYIKSGNFFPATWHTQNQGFKQGLKLVDRIEHVAAKRPQPHKTQKHARRNLSTLLVWQKP
jgi:tRNA G10  N-methylase Trm11